MFQISTNVLNQYRHDIRFKYLNFFLQFDKKLSNSAKAAKIDPTGFSGTGGTIQEIELFNFMCHDHLKVELKDNINFIVGNNGSKKFFSKIMVKYFQVVKAQF